MIKRHKNNEK